MTASVAPRAFVDARAMRRAKRGGREGRGGRVTRAARDEQSASERATSADTDDQRAAEGAWQIGVGESNWSDAALERRNKALAALLDQTMLDKKMLERALNKRIEDVSADLVNAKIEIEKAKMDAARQTERQRAVLYAEVERDLTARLRQGMEKELQANISKYRAEADRAQAQASERAKMISDLMSNLEKSVRTEAMDQIMLLRASFEKSTEADAAKIKALEETIAAMDAQAKALKDFAVDHESIREDRDRLSNLVTEKDQKILSLSKGLEDANKQAADALARLTSAESKIVQMDKIVESRVKLTTQNASIRVDAALVAKNAAEERAEEIKRMSDELITAAVMRAETAETQLFRQTEILEEFAAVTDAKIKATELLVQLQEETSAQKLEIEELRKLVEVNVADATTSKAEAMSVEAMKSRVVQETTEQVKEMQETHQKRMKIMQTEMEGESDEFEMTLEAKTKEIEALKQEIARLSHAARSDNERFERDIRVQTEVAATWRARAEFMAKSIERDEDPRKLLEERRSRLKTNFNGPLLRKFVAHGWNLPEEHQRTWENGSFAHDIDVEIDRDHKFDPHTEIANAKRLGTTGWSARARTEEP